MKNKDAKVFLFVLLATIAAAVVYFLVYQKTVALSADIVLKKESIAIASAKDKELSSIQQDIKATLGDYDKIKNIFVAKEEVVDFIQQFESLGQDMGLDVKINGVSNSEFDPAVQDKELLTVSFFAYGTRSKTLNFLELLENFPQKTTLNNISIDKEGIVGEPERGWKLSGDVTVVKFK